MVNGLQVEIFNVLLSLYQMLVPLLLVANIFFAVTIVFVERKKPTRAVSWILVLLLLPFLGFFLYLIFGQNYPKETKFSLKNETDQKLTDLMASQIYDLPLAGCLSPDGSAAAPK